MLLVHLGISLQEQMAWGMDIFPERVTNMNFTNWTT